MEYKGVVYNEMKGVYSSADDRNFRNSMKLLFPDNNYHHCSGGEPEDIIKLSYEELKVNIKLNTIHLNRFRIIIIIIIIRAMQGFGCMGMMIQLRD